MGWGWLGDSRYGRAGTHRLRLAGHREPRRDVQPSGCLANLRWGLEAGRASAPATATGPSAASIGCTGQNGNFFHQSHSTVLLLSALTRGKLEAASGGSRVQGHAGEASQNTPNPAEFLP